MFKGKKIFQEIKNWLAEFQQTLHKTEGNQHLRFNSQIRTNERNLYLTVKEDKVQVVTNDELPFLNMKKMWYPKGDLQFSVFRKKEQKIKCVLMGSTHTLGTIRLILSGVLNRLSKLTSRKTSFGYGGFDKIYPLHANALHKTGLAPHIFQKWESYRTIRSRIWILRKKKNPMSKKRETEMGNFLLHTHTIFQPIFTGWSEG